MFTGIVDHCGLINKITPTAKNISITVDSDFTDLVLGESIAIDGICLTVTSHEKNQFTVDVSPETMRLTKAVQYDSGSLINLERPLRLMDRLGGHFVTGHVDGLCTVKEVTPADEFVALSFTDILTEHQSLLVKKGSIAINGVSLTINDVIPNGFSVMLIPHTLQRTNLSRLKAGDCVNVEYDYLAKLISNQINSERL